MVTWLGSLIMPTKLALDVVVATAGSALWAVDADVTSLSSLVEKFGITAALLLYFVIRDHLRSKQDLMDRQATQSRFEALDAYVRDTLTEEIRASNEDRAKSRECLNDLAEALVDSQGISSSVRTKIKQRLTY